MSQDDLRAHKKKFRNDRTDKLGRQNKKFSKRPSKQNK